MHNYPIKEEKKGFCIIGEDGQIVDNFYWPERWKAEKRRDIIIAFRGGLKNEHND